MELQFALLIIGALVCLGIFAYVGYKNEKKKAERAQQDSLRSIRARINDEPIDELIRAINERDRSGSGEG